MIFYYIIYTGVSLRTIFFLEQFNVNISLRVRLNVLIKRMMCATYPEAKVLPSLWFKEIGYYDSWQNSGLNHRSEMRRRVTVVSFHLLANYDGVEEQFAIFSMTTCTCTISNENDLWCYIGPKVVKDPEKHDVCTPFPSILEIFAVVVCNGC